jgi:hypothetical protein
VSIKYLLLIEIIIILIISSSSRSSSVDIATGYGLDDRGSIPGGVKIFLLLHSIQIGSAINPASCPIGAEGFLIGDKAAGA